MPSKTAQKQLKTLQGRFRRIVKYTFSLFNIKIIKYIDDLKAKLLVRHVRIGARDRHASQPPDVVEDHLLASLAEQTSHD